MSEPIKNHEISTYSGRSWALTQPEFTAMNERLEAGARFLTAPDAQPPDYIGSKIAVSDIKFFGKRQMSMSDMINEHKALPEGKKEFDPTAPGYIKFLVGSIKLRRKLGIKVHNITNILTEEQKKLVFQEMKRQGLIDENNNFRTDTEPKKQQDNGSQ